MEQECLNIQQLPNMCVGHSTAAPVVTDSTLNHQNGAKGELEEEHINKKDPGVPEDNVIEDVH